MIMKAAAPAQWNPTQAKTGLNGAPNICYR
jgi:hypothetical protein